MSSNDKFEIGEIFKKRAIRFYISNKEKHRWLITKYIAIWFLYANSEEIKRVYKTLTSGNISIGKRGIRFKFDLIGQIPNAQQSQYFQTFGCLVDGWNKSRWHLQQQCPAALAKPRTIQRQIN